MGVLDMNEDFVSFELLSKLREKGYYYEGRHIYEVLKWLRKEKDVDVVICPIFVYAANDRAKEYCCKIYAPQLNKPVPMDEYQNCYESAALDGIKYVINNLI